MERRLQRKYFAREPVLSIITLDLLYITSFAPNHFFRAKLSTVSMQKNERNFSIPTPQCFYVGEGGLDRNSGNRGYARLGGAVASLSGWHFRYFSDFQIFSPPKAIAGQRACGSGPRLGRSRQKWPHGPTRDGSVSGTCHGPPWATCRCSDPRWIPRDRAQ